jgi:hypothetical protein
LLPESFCVYCSNVSFACFWLLGLIGVMRNSSFFFGVMLILVAVAFG